LEWELNSTAYWQFNTLLLTLCLTTIFGLFLIITLIQKAAILPPPFLQDLLEYVPEERELVHKDLKNAVSKREVVRWFCWNRKPLQTSHIIAQKNIPMAFDESCLLQRAGLTQKHQVQNGLLLCRNYHDTYDLLKRYVDVVDGKLVVKVVNETN
jgi:hypothetical protein